MAVLQAVHWFNPLLWYTFHRMRADRELACDADVLARTGGPDAVGYGRTILKFAENTVLRPMPAGAVGITEIPSET